MTFHAIEEAAAPIFFPPDLFRRGLARLAAAGFTTLDLAAAAQCLACGEPIPERSLVLTFDDGFRSVYTEAFPALRQHGFSATVFLRLDATDANAGFLATHGSAPERPLLRWHEIREMHREGICFGAHSLSHSDLTGLDDDSVAHEMLASKRVIEDALATPVRSFAYPCGLYDGRSRRIAAANFHVACTDTLALASARSDRYALPRIDAYYLRSEATFPLLLSPILPLYIRTRALPRAIRRVLYGRNP